MKSFLCDRIVNDQNGNEVIFKEKVVCFWSRDFDAREKNKREDLENRIQEFLKIFLNTTLRIGLVLKSI